MGWHLLLAEKEQGAQEVPIDSKVEPAVGILQRWLGKFTSRLQFPTGTLTPTQGCHRCPPNLNCCTYWSRARNQAKAGRGARNNSFHLLSTYLVCICCWVRCFVNIISHFYNLVAIPSVSDLRMKKKDSVNIIIIILFLPNSYWVFTICHTFLKHITCHLLIYHHINAMVLLLPPFYRWGNEALGKLNNSLGHFIWDAQNVAVTASDTKSSGYKSGSFWL